MLIGISYESPLQLILPHPERSLFGALVLPSHASTHRERKFPEPVLTVFPGQRTHARVSLYSGGQAGLVLAILP